MATARTLIQVEVHPLLHLAAFTTHFAGPLGGAPVPASWVPLYDLDAETPVARSEEHRQAVRRLLRHGGYRPTGRGKPASEYLVRAASEGPLRVINPAVDACNVVSLHSGLPISVVDLDQVSGPLRVGLAAPGDHYVFNASGQEIDLAGLLCLFDEAGPCANAVKDSQRTKTGDDTTVTLSLVWGSHALTAGHLAATVSWYRSLLEEAGATTAAVVEP